MPAFVDDGVEPAERRGRGRDDRLRAVHLATHRRATATAVAARRADLVDRALRALRVAPADRNRRSLACEAVRDLAADPARRAGHECALAVESAHSASSFQLEGWIGEDAGSGAAVGDDLGAR